MTTGTELTREIIQELIDGNPGGFTANSWDFTLTKDSGWVVGGLVPELNIFNVGTLGWDNVTLSHFIANFMALREALGERVYLGGWESANTVYLDASVLVHSVEHAKTLATLYRQRAFGRLRFGEYVGELRGFGDDWAEFYRLANTDRGEG